MRVSRECAAGLGVMACFAGPAALGAQTLRSSFTFPAARDSAATAAAALHADCEERLRGDTARRITKRAVERAIQLECPPSPKRLILAEIYADANVRRAVGQTDGGQVAAGSLGAFFMAETMALDFFVNTVGATTAVRGDYGASVLAPGAGGSFNAGLIEARKLLGDGNDRRRSGVRAYASVSSGRWQPQDTSRTPVGFVASGLGLGLFYSIGGRVPAFVADNANAKNDSSGHKSLSAVLDVGAAYRDVGGDISDGRSTDTNVVRLRDEIGLATMRRWSPEIGLTIGYNGLKAGVTWYQFGGRMRGFSRSQVVAGISVQSTLASGFLNP